MAPLLSFPLPPPVLQSFPVVELSQLSLRDISEPHLPSHRAALVQSIHFRCLSLEPQSQVSQVSLSPFLLLLQGSVIPVMGNPY